MRFQLPFKRVARFASGSPASRSALPLGPRRPLIFALLLQPLFQVSRNAVFAEKGSFLWRVGSKGGFLESRRLACLGSAVAGFCSSASCGAVRFGRSRDCSGRVLGSGALGGLWRRFSFSSDRNLGHRHLHWGDRSGVFEGLGGMSGLSEGDGWGGEGLHCFPEDACCSLIFLHGLGDTASGWQMPLRGILRQLDLQQRVRLLLPTAARRPVTICGGKMRAWSDIRGLTKEAPEDKGGLLRSRDRVIALVEKEVAAGISPKRIIIGGFSQGGAVAYLTALTMPFSVGGVLALSTWVPLGEELQFSPSVAANFPRILHLHGGSDEVVRLEYGKLSCEKIRERLDPGQQHRVQFREFPRMQHEACDEELKEAARFIKEVFFAQEH